MINSKMVNEKSKKNSNRGGAREGAGRPPLDQPKTKISVSVDTVALNAAMSKWNGGKSALVEKLLFDYVDHT